MAIRLLPFRQYAEEDVVNLFALVDGSENNKVTDSGAGDAGVFVKVSAGDFGADPVGYETNSYLGETNYPFIGRNQYPTVPLKVEPATAGAPCLGVTLFQTAKTDENDEKLLYYPQKKLETQSVLPGEAVPILGKGVVTLATTAFDSGTIPAVGEFVVIGSESGKLAGAGTTMPAVAGVTVVGQVLANGERVNRGVSDDQFAGASVGTGSAPGTDNYAVVRINC